MSAAMHPIRPPLRTAIPRQRGLTLVELMVSLVAGLLLLVAMSAVFVGSSTSRREVELSADVIENGRYGIDVLTRELSQAGFYGPLDAPTGATVDLCSTTKTEWADSLTIHVAGLNNATVDPACLTRKAGTDAVLVQRASTCVVGEAACEAESASNGYIQVSECGPEYSGGAKFVLEPGGDATPFVLQTRTCDGAKAPKRKLIRRIFYVSADDVLSYVDVRLDGVQPPVALADNIEQMQLEYAVDADGDGTAESFASVPANWAQVIGVRVWLLARSTAPSKNTGGAIDFVMADTTHSVAAASSNLKRRVYQTYIPFVTPKSRRES